MFLPDGSEAFNVNAGIRISGGCSRTYAQKSFNVYMRRNTYGSGAIDYPLFAGRENEIYERIKLRNSGQDYLRTMFRDGLVQTLLWDKIDMDLLGYQPTTLYLNGEFWGIYNIREKVNRYFIASHHDVHKDSIDLLEHRGIRKRGSKKHYQRLIQFLKKNDLSNSANFAWVASQMEIDNFIDYQITQIYFDNQDAGGNIKYWRPQTPNGKWRWILYDTDWGYSLHQKKAWKNNSLAFHTEPNGPSWPNPSWSTLILRKLLKNEEFQHRFLNRFADRLNTSFTPSVTEQKIEEFYINLKPEISRHLRRWRKSKKVWEAQVQLLRNFAAERPTYVWQHLLERFEPGELNELGIESIHGGHVILNETLRIDDEFQGNYFSDLPIKLEAVPHLGYRFSHWENDGIQLNAKELTLQISEPQQNYRAIFEKYEHPLAEKIIINEISCNNKMTKDWLELYNNSDEPVKLRDWVLTDKKHEYRLDDVTIMPKDYVVFSEDSSKFFRIFPKAYSVAGSFDFGLDKRNEVIGLFTDDGAFIDSVSYEVAPSDTAFTLNLLLPWLDNSIQKRQRLWMEMGAGITVILMCMLALYFRKQGVLKI